MQRILNNPDNIVDEMVDGFVSAHADIVERTANPRVIKSVEPVSGRVGIVTGGGSGHKPAFIGYLGKNMCDAVAVGEIFSSPTAVAFHDAFKAADGGKGVACLYGNGFALPLINPARRLAADPPDPALQVTDSRLPGITVNDLLQSLI